MVSAIINSPSLLITRRSLQNKFSSNTTKQEKVSIATQKFTSFLHFITCTCFDLSYFCSYNKTIAQSDASYTQAKLVK
jgi:hypothetical protein